MQKETFTQVSDRLGSLGAVAISVMTVLSTAELAHLRVLEPLAVPIATPHMSQIQRSEENEPVRLPVNVGIVNRSPHTSSK